MVQRPDLNLIEILWWDSELCINEWTDAVL